MKAIRLLYLIVLASMAAPLRAEFAYVANQGDNSVSGYTINSTTGALTPVPGSPFATDRGPSSVTVDPTGKFVYVANEGTANGTISAYTINSATGALTPIPGSPFASGITANWITVDPTGKFVYVANFNDNAVFGYTIDSATGALTPIPGSPFAASNLPKSVTVDPTGKFVYALNSNTDDQNNGSISGYTINAATGALTPIPGSPFAEQGKLPGSITVDPTGKFTYVTNINDGNVAGFTINPSNGALTPIPSSPFAAGSNPFSVTVHPTGKFAYVGVQDPGNGNIYVFSINSATGALTPIPGSPFLAGTTPISVTVDPAGKFLYVADDNDNTISVYAINSATGALTAVGSPVFTGIGSLPTSIITTLGPGTTPTPDFAITKTHVGNFTQGQVGATYTITVMNTGAAATSGTVTVTDTVPAGLTATAISGTGWTCTQPSGSCMRSDALGAGSSYPAITLTVNVSATAPATVTNTAMVTGGGVTADADDTANDPTTINSPGVPALMITKAHVGNFIQGQTGATYTITVTNSGTAATTGTVMVTDMIPAGLTATAIGGTGWTCTQPSGSCTRSDGLNGGASYPAITVTVNVAANAPSTVTNMVTVSGGGSAAANASDPTKTTANPPVLTITKTHSGSFSQGQQNATYTVTIGNTAAAGPTSGTVTVTDTIPTGLTLVSMAGSGWTCVSNSCTRSDSLAGGASYPAITVTVNVAANAPSSVTNMVTVSGGGSAKANASDPTNTTANPRVLTITKTHSGSFAQGQQNATYTVTVGNTAGAGPTSGTVTVTDTIPTGLTLVSMAGSGWSCVSNSCTRSDALAGGASYPAITVTVNVAANAPSTVTNMVTVSGGGSAAANASDPTNTTATAPVLTITKSHSGSFAQGQQNATYTVTVGNTAGAGPTSGTVTVTDTIPTGLTLVSMAGTGWVCPANTCTRSDALAGGASYPAITVTVNVAANAPSTVSNMVTVSGGGSTGANASDPTNVTSGQFAFTWTANPSNGGIVTPLSGTLFNSGATATVTAIPNACFAFAGFGGDLSGTTNPASLLINGPKMVIANFILNAAMDVTAQMTTALSGFRFNRPTGNYLQGLTVTNTGFALSGPVYVALDALTGGAVLINATGTTACAAPAGSPFILVSNTGLPAGQSITITLQFTAAGGPPINYTPRYLTGSGLR